MQSRPARPYRGPGLRLGHIHGFSKSEQERLIEQAQVPAPGAFGELSLTRAGRLLELEIILDWWPGLAVTGLEISASHILAARRRLSDCVARKQASLIRGDAHRLPVAPQSFDCVITIWMLEHVSGPHTVPAEG